MTSVQVCLLKTDCHSDTREMTKRSLRLAGKAEVTECAQEELDGLVMATKADAVHVVVPRVIVLPDFYRAMLYTLELSGFDFVFCRAGVLDDASRVVRPGESGFDSAQVIVRTWVYREIGVGNIGPTDLVGRVLGEYRGVEVPHVLMMRV